MSLAEFEKQFGKPAGKALSRLIRPMIAAPEGKVLVWGDWSNIEARGLPWLARAEERLDIFRAIDADPENTPDVYLQAAAGMYHLDPYTLLVKKNEGDREAKAYRQKGKIAELALGFSGGPGALQTMAAKYGMAFDAHEAADIVERWRAANQWAVAYWNDLMAAFIEALSNPDGRMVPAGRVAYQGVQMGNELWVICYLPDGRPLFYRNVRERKHVTYDDFDPTVVVSTERKLSFESESGVKWIWRGLLAENIDQAACASILRATLLRLDSPGFDFMPVVGHTHDEIITMTNDTPDHVAAAKVKLAEAMMTNYGWNDGLPTAVDITSHTWYSKAMDD